MPNWCYTDYAITGNYEQVKDLYLKIKSLSDNTESLLENVFGKLWIGNLIYLLGGNTENIYCRSEIIEPIDYENESIRFTVMSAWSELDEVRNFIITLYPDIKVYFISEEGGCDYFVTNDKEKIFFKEQYILDIIGEDTYYYSDIEEVLTAASEITGKVITKKEELTDLLEEYEEQMQEQNPDYLINFHEFEIAD